MESKYAELGIIGAGAMVRNPPIRWAPLPEIIVDKKKEEKELAKRQNIANLRRQLALNRYSNGGQVAWQGRSILNKNITKDEPKYLEVDKKKELLVFKMLFDSVYRKQQAMKNKDRVTFWKKEVMKEWQRIVNENYNY